MLYSKKYNIAPWKVAEYLYEVTYNGNGKLYLK